MKIFIEAEKEGEDKLFRVPEFASMAKIDGTHDGWIEKGRVQGRHADLNQSNKSASAPGQVNKPEKCIPCGYNKLTK